MLAAADPVNAARIAPFEMEASRAAQDKRGDSRDKIREAAMTIPVDVLSRGLQSCRRTWPAAPPACCSRACSAMPAPTAT
jgi:hypothetical protein